MYPDKMKLVGGGKSDTILLPVEPGYADEVQGDIKAALEVSGFQFNGRDVWVQVERAPWIQKRYATFGMVRAFLQQTLETNDGIDDEMHIRFECTWQPEFVILATDLDIGGAEVVEVGFIDEDAECHFNNEWATSTMGISAEGLKAKFWVFRQRRRQ